MTTRRKIDRVALREELRKKYPGGPREALRKLGLDESLLDVSRLALDGANPMPNRLQFLAITRTAAVAMEIEAVATDQPSALRTLIKQVGRTREEQSEERIAMDTGDDESGEQRSGFDSRWGDTAGRIGHA